MFLAPARPTRAPGRGQAPLAGPSPGPDPQPLVHRHPRPARSRSTFHLVAKSVSGGPPGPYRADALSHLLTHEVGHPRERFFFGTAALLIFGGGVGEGGAASDKRGLKRLEKETAPGPGGCSGPRSLGGGAGAEGESQAGERSEGCQPDTRAVSNKIDRPKRGPGGSVLGRCGPVGLEPAVELECKRPTWTCTERAFGGPGIERRRQARAPGTRHKERKGGVKWEMR